MKSISINPIIEILKNEEKTKKLFDNSCQELIEILKQCYGDDLEERHRYSEIFTLLYKNEKQLENISFNVTELYNGYMNNRNYIDNNIIKKVDDKIVKLYDHISLDIARIQYLKLNYNPKIEEIERNLKTSKDEINNITASTESYKFDIVGLIAGTLSLFTIFGVDYSIIINLVSKDKFTGRQFITMFILLNLTVILILRILLFTLKELFSYNYNFKFKKHILDIIILGIIFIIFYIYKYM